MDAIMGYLSAVVESYMQSPSQRLKPLPKIYYRRLDFKDPSLQSSFLCSSVLVPPLSRRLSLLFLKVSVTAYLM